MKTGGLRLGFCAVLIVLLTLILTGCDSVSPKATAEQFYTLWGERDYADMYELLDEECQKIYSKEHFGERYANISNGIGLLGIELGKPEITDSSSNRSVLSLSAILQTSTVGEIPVHYRLELSREKKGASWLLNWRPDLIFPQLGDDDSRVEVKSESPRRGVIFDRHGKILAGPRVFKELGAVPGVYEDENAFAQAIEKLLGLPAETILGKLHQSWVREGLYVPLTILTPQEEELVDPLLEIQGVMINEVQRRYYPAGASAAHLIGYLGEITAEELAQKEASADPGGSYRAGDLLGQAGLEAALESLLAGRRGNTLCIVDGQGRELSQIARSELIEGQDVNLTLDLELQKCAAEALADRRGAVVALDPQSGDILALCSNPSFDPNRFIAGMGAAEWRGLLESEAQPLMNRALSGLYPPGSILKPFTAAAAISAGVLDPAEKIMITGEDWQPSASWGDYYVRRVHPEVEKLNLVEAMKYSDNIYFARAGLALGIDKFMEYGERFGFGEQIAFPLPAARSRLSPDGIKNEIQLADSAYGQGEVMITPLQAALLYSAFAGDGSIWQPRLLAEAGPARWKEQAISSEVVKAVHSSLVEAVQGAGAPSGAGAIAGMRVAGKTGTAETETSVGNVCWYVTYGPAESPRIVVAVLVEEGTMASQEALPVGRAVLEHFLRTGGS